MRFSNLLKENDNSAVKAAFYYIVCQFLVKGMSFITTPIFSRLLSKAEYGAVSNFVSWEGLIFPIVTLNLRASITKSKYDYPDDNDNFLSSILIAAILIISISYLVVECNSLLFENIFSMPIKYIRMLFLYLIFMTAFDFQQIQYNAYRKYKTYVFYSLISVFLNMFLSIILVILLPDKFVGRIAGIIIPCVFVGCIIYINALKKGRHPKFYYAKRALVMTVPLLFSALSANVLSSSDRVMITKLSGEQDNAMYSIAYSVAGVATVVFTALNQAWAPWMLDHLKVSDFGTIRKRAKQFAVIYSILILGVMLVSPEIILIMGGRLYYDARYVMPPVILALVFQYFYSFFFDTEYFYGETYIISIGTFIAAIINVLLNLIFIPKYGYIAAAYTTFVGYGVMLLYHFLIVKFKLKKDFIFPVRLFFKLIIILMLIQIVIVQIYDVVVIRYAAVGVYVGILFFFVMKYDIPRRILNKFKNQTTCG